MKKFILAAFLLLTVGIAGAAEFIVPVSVNNIPDSSLKAAGVDVAALVTSTTPALVTDSAGTTMTNGFVYWVIAPSTGAANVYLTLRSTGTANVTSAHLIPRISPVTMGANGVTSSPIIVFDPPIPFVNGLCAVIEPAAAAPSTGVEYSVGVRWQRQ